MKIIVIVFLLFSSSVFSQMLDNRNGAAFTDKPFFDQQFIAANKIHFLNGQFSYKKLGDMMRTTEYKYVYEFDTLGRMIGNYETRKDDGTKDTTWNLYSYNVDNLLIEHKKGDGKGFTSMTYEYDDQKRIIKESYVREYVDSFGMSQRTILNTESMKYENYGQQIKKTTFNSYDLPYMTEISYYNDLGYLIEKEQRLIMTGTVNKITYEYNHKGLLSNIKSTVLGAEIPYEELQFIYDDNGNLLDKHIYRNGQYITEIEMLYNDKSKLLTYVLTRDVATTFIMILGFKDYKFYK